MAEARFTWWQLVWRPILKGLRAVAIGYVGVLVVLLLLETFLVFPASTASQVWVPPPSDEFQDVNLVTESGTKIHAWYLPHPTSDKTVLLLHGNAGNLSIRGGTVVQLRKILDASVFIVDYPGYGKSEGSPSETGCCQAATASYDWLIDKQNRDPKKLILYGESLGGGVAVELASRKPHGALVLVKTFTSLPDVAAYKFPWVPARWLMQNRLASIDRIGNLTTPVFIAHGDVDRVIPYALGKQLFDAAAEPKKFVRLVGQDHNDQLGEDFVLPLRAFLEQHMSDVAASRGP